MIPECATSQNLTSWVQRLHFKRNEVRGRRNRDLRVEAMVGYAVQETKSRLEKVPKGMGRVPDIQGLSDLCSCERCPLCLRQFYSGYDKCYCRFLVAKRSSKVTDTLDVEMVFDNHEDEEGLSKKFEDFFAEMDLATKKRRKRSSCTQQDSRLSKKLRWSSS